MIVAWDIAIFYVSITTGLMPLNCDHDFMKKYWYNYINFEVEHQVAWLISRHKLNIMVFSNK